MGWLLTIWLYLPLAGTELEARMWFSREHYCNFAREKFMEIPMLHRLSEGDLADVVVLDPERSWTYDTSKGYSKSRNSPWEGEALTGRVIATFVNGSMVYHADRGVLMS